MKQIFHGRYVSGSLYQGKSGSWITDISYIGIKGFKTKDEALKWMERHGVFQRRNERA
ncbi:hypothetical protein NST02_23480 [Robertmurraya sp. FSL W8-0741]|uniref:hypothetical protein n=1 Tax=Robertmurraya sp. FSL W8-0741 TaxID=2954629 RepID=UPI0030FBDDEF